MNWQTLGPKLHAAVKAYIGYESIGNATDLLQLLALGDDAGDKTEWDPKPYENRTGIRRRE